MEKYKAVWLVFCCLAAGVRSATLPVAFHAGRLDALERSSAARKFVRQDEALKKGQLDPQVIEDSLLEERTPEESNVYVLLKISVLPGRSLSPLDYVLVCDGREYPSLGMAVGQPQIFDFRRLEIQGPAEALLIYECPASAMGATLKTVYQELPVPPLTGLVLQEPEPPPPPAAAEEPQKTEGEPAEKAEKEAGTPAAAEEKPAAGTAAEPEKTPPEKEKKTPPAGSAK